MVMDSSWSWCVEIRNNGQVKSSGWFNKGQIAMARTLGASKHFHNSKTPNLVRCSWYAVISTYKSAPKEEPVAGSSAFNSHWSTWGLNSSPSGPIPAKSLFTDKKVPDSLNNLFRNALRNKSSSKFPWSVGCARWTRQIHRISRILQGSSAHVMDSRPRCIRAV